MGAKVDSGLSSAEVSSSKHLERGQQALIDLWVNGNVGIISTSTGESTARFYSNKETLLNPKFL